MKSSFQKRSKSPSPSHGLGIQAVGSRNTRQSSDRNSQQKIWQSYPSMPPPPQAAKKMVIAETKNAYSKLPCTSNFNSTLQHSKWWGILKTKWKRIHLYIRDQAADCGRLWFLLCPKKLPRPSSESVDSLGQTSGLNSLKILHKIPTHTIKFKMLI